MSARWLVACIDQSRAHSSAMAAAPKTAMRCHYEVIGVERTATTDEIKKAFRRKALELHPGPNAPLTVAHVDVVSPCCSRILDKHPDEFEFYTQEFQLLQSAHAVLSDTQERAWYDNHRDAILRGGTCVFPNQVDRAFSNRRSYPTGQGAGDGDSEGIDVTVYFSSSAFSAFDDSPTVLVHELYAFQLMFGACLTCTVMHSGLLYSF
jgi:DnaJ homolog subfamily A member 5